MKDGGCGLPAPRGVLMQTWDSLMGNMSRGGIKRKDESEADGRTVPYLTGGGRPDRDELQLTGLLEETLSATGAWLWNKMAQRACEMDVGVHQKRRWGWGGVRFCLVPTKQTEQDEVVSSLSPVD